MRRSIAGLVIATTMAAAGLGIGLLWKKARTNAPSSPGEQHAGGPVAPTSPEQTDLAAEQRAAIRRASRTSDRPAVLSALAAAAPFDHAAFQRDPNAYLSEVEPGRCFQSAEGGPDAIPLRLLTASNVRAAEGDPVMLAIRGAPWAPVTFTAFDGGVFRNNGLSTVTVRAAKDGTAAVQFVPPAGARGAVVRVGSPLAVGTQIVLVDAAEAHAVAPGAARE